MANHFDFLAHAKPASLHKLIDKLSIADAAIVLTGLPHKLAVQTIAFLPADKQAPMLPAMQDARRVSDDLREKTAAKVRGILDAAKNARAGAAASPVGSPPPPAAKPQPKPPETSFKSMDRSASILTGSVPEEFADEEPAPPAAGPAIPLTPKFTPPGTTTRKASAYAPNAEQSPASAPVQPVKPAATPKNFKTGTNPYENAPPAHELPPASKDDRQMNSGELIGQAVSDLGDRIRKLFSPIQEPAKQPEKAKPAEDGFKTRSQAESRSSAPGSGKKPAPPPRPENFNKPVPWQPRQATSSPINGPALPGKPPPIAGDPFKSPLAKAGLLDLIGRAQEKYMPKGKAQKPVTPPPLRIDKKTGRPEAVEGVLGHGKIKIDSTPRVIGPRPRAEELVGDDRLPAPGSGARRMDGKAIMAAILRNAPRELRRTVAKDDPKLFSELHKRMFYFDDLIFTEDNSLARVFTTAPTETAALALKFAAPKLRDRVLAVVSPGRAKALCDTPSRAGLDEIEAAQKQVLNVALKLQAAGRILIDPRDPDLA